MKIIIGYLYPELMNIYGDTGNIIALTKRAEWRGIEVEIKHISSGTRIPTFQVGTRVDLFFFGGGQDQAQEVVAKDLIASGKGKIIKEDVERGVPLLAICGGYQLLGEYYQPHGKPKLSGVGLFPAYTIAGDKRMIGNVVIESEFGKLVGFENHSGKTYLQKGAQPLGKVITGFGNNGEDHNEGGIFKNAIGCYLHGSLLPKNPQLADWLLTKALETKYGSPRFAPASTHVAVKAGKKIELEPLDDTLENQAQQAIISKFC